MKQKLALLCALTACGGADQGGSPEGPPTPQATVMTCSQLDTLGVLPTRQYAHKYTVIRGEKVTAEFSVTYSIGGVAKLTTVESKTYEGDDREHAALANGPYFIYSDRDHAHLFRAHDKTETKLNCEVK